MAEVVRQVEELADCLLANKATLSVAESCTGGAICQLLTDFAGSSAWFERGFITYSNLAKQEMLGVKLTTLKAYGAVSEAVALEMAQGVLHNSPSQYAISVSGIAGPGGAVAGKPVGTVCFAWADGTEFNYAETVYFQGDRIQVRIQARDYALKQLLFCLKK